MSVDILYTPNKNDNSDDEEDICTVTNLFYRDSLFKLNKDSTIPIEFPPSVLNTPAYLHVV